MEVASVGDGKHFAIGETAGTGAYRCCKCGSYVAVLTGPKDQIPPCENCGANEDVFYAPCDADAAKSHGVEPRQSE